MPQGGEECLCYGCNNVFPKDEYGLTCPRCGSEFVEIVWALVMAIARDRDKRQKLTILVQIEGSSEEPPAGQSPASWPNPAESPTSQLFNHNPWAETGLPPLNNGQGNGPTLNRHSYRSPDGRITFTTTFATGLPGRQRNVGSPAPFAGNDPLMQSFNAIFQGLAGATYNNRYQDPMRAGDLGFDPDGRRDLHGGLRPRDADGPQPMRHPIGSMNEYVISPPSIFVRAHIL